MLKYKNLIVWLILLCAIISECMAASTNPTWIGSPFFRTGQFTYVAPVGGMGSFSQDVTVPHLTAMTNNQIATRKVVIGYMDLQLYMRLDEMNIKIRYKSSFVWGFDFTISMDYQQDLYACRISYIQADPSITQNIVINQFYQVLVYQYQQYTPAEAGPFSLVYPIDINTLYSVTLNPSQTITKLISLHAFRIGSPIDNCYQTRPQILVTNSTHLQIKINTVCTLDLYMIGFSYIVFDQDVLTLLTASYSLAPINYFAVNTMLAIHGDYMLLNAAIPGYVIEGFMMCLSRFKVLGTGLMAITVQQGAFIYVINAMLLDQIQITYWVSILKVCPSTHPFFYSSDQNCYDTCPDYSITDTMLMQCLPCHFSCLTCSTAYSSSNCLSCASTDNRILSSTTCQPKVGFYESNTQIASSCSIISSCLQCTTSAHCTRCSLGSYINTMNLCSLCSSVDTHCAKCTTTAGNFVCQACVGGYALRVIDGTCQPCSSFKPYCLLCINSAICSSCPAGFALLAGSCVSVCGNSVVTGLETCDDGNTVDGDGCSSTCLIQCSFYMVHCTGCSTTSACTSCSLGYAPVASSCATVCGDSIVIGAETCDDGNTVDLDGCSSTCTIQCDFYMLQCTSCSSSSHCLTCTAGFVVQAVSSCVSVCGDSIVVGVETCDDGNIVSGDGCSSTCLIECGFYMSLCTSCSSTTDCLSCVSGYTVQRGSCATVCGDSIRAGLETCDDGNIVDGDGCSSTCDIQCSFYMLQCTSCSSTALCLSCTSGFVVQASSSCVAVCGDSMVLGSETCDDGNIISGDGCSSTCLIQCAFYMPDCATCSTTSVCSSCSLGFTLQRTGTCATVCGDLITAGTQTCDDGNLIDADGCSSICAIECSFYMLHCLTCSTTAVCSTCSLGYGVQAGSCVPVCGDHIMLGNQTCDDGGVISGDGCSSICGIQCSFFMPNCFSCITITTCISCNTGYNLTAGTCKTNQQNTTSSQLLTKVNQLQTAVITLGVACALLIIGICIICCCFARKKRQREQKIIAQSQVKINLKTGNSFHKEQSKVNVQFPECFVQGQSYFNSHYETNSFAIEPVRIRKKNKNKNKTKGQQKKIVKQNFQSGRHSLNNLQPVSLDISNTDSHKKLRQQIVDQNKIDQNLKTLQVQEYFELEYQQQFAGKSQNEKSNSHLIKQKEKNIQQFSIDIDQPQHTVQKNVQIQEQSLQQNIEQMRIQQIQSNSNIKINSQILNKSELNKKNQLEILGNQNKVQLRLRKKRKNPKAAFKQ